jgi:hypothetical protein
MAPGQSVAGRKPPSLHWQACHPVNFRQRVGLSACVMALLPNLAGLILCFGLTLRIQARDQPNKGVQDGAQRLSARFSVVSSSDAN